MTEPLFQVGYGLWGIITHFRDLLETQINENVESKDSEFYIMCEIFGSDAIPSGPYLEILPLGMQQFEENNGWHEDVETYHEIEIPLSIYLRNQGSGEEFVRQNFAFSYVISNILRKGRVIKFGLSTVLEIKEFKESQLFIGDQPGISGFKFGQEISCVLRSNIKGR